MAGSTSNLLQYITLTEDESSVAEDLKRNASKTIKINGTTIEDLAYPGDRYETFKDYIAAVNEGTDEGQNLLRSFREVFKSIVTEHMNADNIDKNAMGDFVLKRLHQGGLPYCANLALSADAFSTNLQMCGDFIENHADVTVKNDKITVTSNCRVLFEALRLVSDPETPVIHSKKFLDLRMAFEARWDTILKKPFLMLTEIRPICDSSIDHTDVIPVYKSAKTTLDTAKRYLDSVLSLKRDHIHYNLYHALASATSQYETFYDGPKKRVSYSNAMALLTETPNKLTPGEAFCFIAGMSGNGRSENSLRVLFLKELEKRGIGKPTSHTEEAIRKSAVFIIKNHYWQYFDTSKDFKPYHLTKRYDDLSRFFFYGNFLTTQDPKIKESRSIIDKIFE